MNFNQIKNHYETKQQESEYNIRDPHTTNTNNKIQQNRNRNLEALKMFIIKLKNTKI